MARTGWGRALRHLVEAGLLDGEIALGGRLVVESASRSNQVGIVLVEGEPTLVLKCHEIVVDDVDPFVAEVDAYRWLAGESNIAAMAPRLVSVHDRVVVLEARARLTPFHEALANPTAEPARLLEALGRQLAALHAAPADRGALRSRRPWVLGVPDGAVPEALAPDPGIGPLVAEIAAVESLRAATREFGSLWRASAPMHGDVKFDNILVDIEASSEEPRVTIFDWELAGLGFPAWDLAGLLDGLIVPALQSADIETAINEAGHAKSTIATYRSLVGSDLAPEKRTLVVATIARLVQSTIQLHAMRHLEPQCEQRARRVLEGASALAEQIADGASGPAWAA